MRIISFLIVTSAVLAWMPVRGEEPAHDVRIVPRPDGFLEIDGRTAAVSECRREVGGYKCSLVSQNPDPLQRLIKFRILQSNREVPCTSNRERRLREVTPKPGQRCPR